MIERILGIILPVFVVIAVGYLYARRVRPDMAQINHLSMNILGPALIFSALASKEFDLAANAVLMLGSIGVVLGSGLAAWPVARALRVDFRTLGPTAMFNNCGNMGLPLAILAFGQTGFSAMVALFTISNLLQFTVGVRILDQRARLDAVLRNPMVWATVLGFAFALAQPPMPEWAYTGIKLVGDALIPVMLLALGVRLFEVRWDDWHIGVVGGVLCPVAGIAMALALAPLLGLSPMQRGLLILFGALPPAVLNFMVAEQFRQEPAKVASIVLIGNLLSVVFVPIGLALAIE
ncbi:MAG: AEC family transporter [Burkholderiales bacterium]|nr:AEC family transporter [Burkholderiales bacterium]